ncbi:MAG: cupin domain-containing protein [Chloroflexota bacterium]
MNAQEIIQLLDLQPLPEEGGYFRRTYESADRLQPEQLPQRYQRDHASAMSSAIYALFTLDDFSAMHRLDADEIYHYYWGDPLELLLLYPNGVGKIVLLGTDFQAGMQPQLMVPKGVWQGSRPMLGGTYGCTLIGTTMSPEFVEAGFEMATREELIRDYPSFTPQIETRVR